MNLCTLCPRGCGIARSAGEIGVCGSSAAYSVAKIMIHNWEEPCIAGERGAGTVFFSGCNLHCLYCQNRDISGGSATGGGGREMTDGELTRAILGLAEQGVNCIEFVTPTHYTDRLAALLCEIKPRLSVPVVWNSGGYEKSESLRLLCGLVDVYLPDFKYFDDELATRYSSAPDYRSRATEALDEMLRQVGKPTFDERGNMIKGVLVRHLVLPSHRRDSMAVLRHLAERFGVEKLRLSLMSQYTPDFYVAAGCPGGHKNLTRKLTSFEYDSVAKEALRLGFEGYFQGGGAADARYTPDFGERDRSVETR